MGDNSVQKLLFRPVDNTPLVVFRVIFGALIMAEAWGAILTGWVKRTFIVPDYNFPFIQFSFLEPLPGNGMYIYFVVMGAVGCLVMLGYKYRYAMPVFALMWSAVYLMQKTNYNNHYYLLMLLSWLMCLLPASRNISLDAKRNPEFRSESCQQWHTWLFVVQITLVYIYASIAKMYPDWFQGIPVRIFFEGKKDYPLVGPWLQKDWVIYLVAYGGILFDLLIAPALLWKKTRKAAFIISIFFHLFNSVIFQVGIFPYLGIAFAIFFFPPQTIRKIFLRKKPAYISPAHFSVKYKRPMMAFLLVYFLIQLALPLRHLTFPGNVNWTEEGHRLSWHMMLRSKAGFVHFRIKTDSAEWVIAPGNYLTSKQAAKVATHPDMAWQFVQYLKKDLFSKGIADPEIYAVGKASLNARPYTTLYNPEIDLAKTEWEPFRHATWLVQLPPD
ncbi:HTTM domain-containing protein [Fulvivirga sedimenti]|uniref:HTTM domain-containing protein n=1 Tax=Fulvivirga sedimenti TaxID=2879465 RepID=A0A9X1HY13_9BACT|nr:HTTM domain-containing protein [Fulvivirga sedimenti]MCA6078592.1 HTTM domain-containing protein [Fulvivirga sedimenti]